MIKRITTLIFGIILISSSFAQDSDSALKANMSYIDWFGKDITVENIFFFANIKASYGQYDIAVDFLSNLLLNFPKFSDKQKERTFYEGPIDSLTCLTIRGFCFSQQNFHEEAIRDYELCLEILRRNDPILKNYDAGDEKLDSFYYWDLIGDANFALGDYEKALKVYDRILKKDSKNERTLQSKTECLIEMGDLHEAIKLVNKGLKKHPDNIIFHKLKAQVLLGIDEKEEACTILKNALEIDYSSNGKYTEGFFDPVIPEIKKMIRVNCK
jgi:tetratricopeptide (TPR) repeat protein